MKIRNVFYSVITAMLFIACNASSSKNSTGETVNKSDSVSLTNTTTNMEEKKYFLQFNSDLAEAGKEFTMSFTPKIKGSENMQVPLETMHEYKIHVIVVSNDLSSYQHLHPEFNSDGSYSVNATLRNGGKYVVFAEYMPSGGMHMVNRFEMNSAGKEMEAKRYSAENLISKTNGHEVKLVPGGGKFTTNTTNHFEAIISTNGKEISANDLENLMSSKGHMVIISADTKKYIHVHPEIENNRLDLHADFETPGTYRAFFQFQTDGKIHLADFVLNVGQGSGNIKSSEHEEHHH